MSKVVSVVIPTFNRPRLLIRAIKSVLAQTYQYLEILVVNDSEDKQPVLEVIEQFDCDKIKYLDNARSKGGNGARNTGILNASGKYIAFLDDDDEWFPNKISHQIKYLSDNNKYQGVFSSFMLLKRNMWIRRTYNIESLRIEHILTNKIGIGASSNLMFQHKIFNEIGIWDENLRRYQDLEFLVRFLSRYEMAYDKNVGLKVFGHNTPNPVILFGERQKYYNKIRDYVTELRSEDQKRFYSLHNRTLAAHLIELKDFKQALDYYKKAARYEVLRPKKDLRNICIFIKCVVNSIFVKV